MIESDQIKKNDSKWSERVKNGEKSWKFVLPVAVEAVDFPFEAVDDADDCCYWDDSDWEAVEAVVAA